MTDPKFYVYAYLRKDGQSPYYIGKGSGDRAWSKKRTYKPPSDKNRIIIIAKSLFEEEAFDLEKKLIKKFGRKDIGTGILANQTDGGEGGSNISPEVRAKRSKALKGVYVGELSVWGGKKNPAQSERKVVIIHYMEYLVPMIENVRAVKNKKATGQVKRTPPQNRYYLMVLNMLLLEKQWRLQIYLPI